MKLGKIDFPNELLDAIRNDNFVVFAGAGVSMGSPANLPSFEYLAKQIAQGTGQQPDDGGDDSSQPAFAKQTAQGTGQQRTKSEPFDRFLGKLQHSGVAVHERAASILSKDSWPTQLHIHLLHLFPSLRQVRIVTTNFDMLFEQEAETLWNESPEIFRAPALPLGHDFRGIIHVHGAVTHPNQMVLTDSDFGRAYLTEGWARRFLVDLFHHHTVLFVGYSHDDVVMHYLARALPEREIGRRFALDKAETDPQFWRLLGIEPITFPTTSDYSHLYEGVRLLANITSRGILDWQLEITRIAQNLPPLDEESGSLLLHVLKDIPKIRFFVETARAPEWISWLDERGVLNSLFEGNNMWTDREQLLARWLADNFALDCPKEMFLLISRHKMKLNPQFWRWLVYGVTKDKQQNNSNNLFVS